MEAGRSRWTFGSLQVHHAILALPLDRFKRGRPLLHKRCSQSIPSSSLNRSAQVLLVFRNRIRKCLVVLELGKGA